MVSGVRCCNKTKQHWIARMEGQYYMEGIWIWINDIGIPLNGGGNIVGQTCLHLIIQETYILPK